MPLHTRQRKVKSMSRFRRLNLAASRAGQTAITDANIATAVEECQAESAAFDCPASQATYGPIEDWDVGAVTSLNNFGNGCTESAGYKCGRASTANPLRLISSGSLRL